MKTVFASVLTAATLATSPAALGADSAQCQNQARAAGRDLDMRRDKMALGDRMRAQHRLGAATALCERDANRGVTGIRGVQRDAVQQSREPAAPVPLRLPGQDQD